MESRDYNDFVGIPWRQGGTDTGGADCWGLTVMVLREVYGIVISDFIGSKASGEELSCIIDGETSSDKWSIADQPRAGDVVMMIDKITKRPLHMGVFIGGGMVLHSPGKGNQGAARQSIIHPVRVLRRAFLRLEFYRYDNSIL